MFQKLLRQAACRLFAFPRLVLVAVLALCAANAMGTEKAAAKGAADKPVMQVEATTVTQVKARERIQAQGSLHPWREAVVTAQVQGLAIVELMVDLGDKVERGQLLARLDPRLPRAELAQVKAQWFEAKSGLEESQLQLERALQLKAKGFFSESQLSNAQHQHSMAKARLDAVQAAVDLRELQLVQTELRASESGIITTKHALLGAIPAPGAELFKILVQSRLEWRAEVTSQDLARIAPGNSARLQLASGEILDGRVRLLGPSIDPANRNGLAYITISGASRSARAGQFVQGSIDVGAREVMSLPQSALVVRDGFTLVFRVNPQQRVRAQKVRPGAVVGDRVEILEGLEPGASVVAKGGALLNDGDWVAIVKP